MPLTTERPGLLRDTHKKDVRWYIANPSAADPVELVEVWRWHLFAPKPQLWRRVLSVAAPIVLTIVIAVPIQFLLLLLLTFNLEATGGLGIVVFTGALVLSIRLTKRLRPWQRRWLPPQGVVILHPMAVEWASDVTALSVVWELNLAISRLEEARLALTKWDEQLATERQSEEGPTPSVVRPLLVAEVDAQKHALRNLLEHLSAATADELDRRRLSIDYL